MVGRTDGAGSVENDPTRTAHIECAPSIAVTVHLSLFATRLRPAFGRAENPSCFPLEHVEELAIAERPADGLGAAQALDHLGSVKNVCAAVVTTLRHVVRQAGNNDAGEAGHVSWRQPEGENSIKCTSTVIDRNWLRQPIGIERRCEADFLAGHGAAAFAVAPGMDRGDRHKIYGSRGIGHPSLFEVLSNSVARLRVFCTHV